MNTLTIVNSDYDAFDALLHSIYEKTQSDNWFKPLQDSDSTGVVLRIDSGGHAAYRVFPYDTPSLLPFESAVRSLNPHPTVAVKLRNASVHAALARLSPTASVLEIDNNTRIQVIDALQDLRVAEKEQCYAFVRNERHLVMWSYEEDPESIVRLWKEFEDKLIKYIWKTRGAPARAENTPGYFEMEGGHGHVRSMSDVSMPHPPPQVYTSPNHPYYHTHSYYPPSLPNSLPSTAPPTPGIGGFPTSSTPASTPSFQPVSFTGPFGMEDVLDREEVRRKIEYGYEESESAPPPPAPSNPKPEPKKGPLDSLLGWWKLDTPSQNTPSNEKGSKSSPSAPPRKLVLLGPFYAGLGAGLTVYFITSGVSSLIEEWVLDGSTTRFALVATLPVIFCVSLFFSLQLIGNLSLIFGPVSQYHENSQYYSAIPPPADPEGIDKNLPHITIQCPVYKESLSETIAPSLNSIKRAMQTYARQGGTSSIFICDDGLRLITDQQREERIRFYERNDVGWVARPKHGEKVDEERVFRRAGKFKKASNMNYALNVSVKLERWLAVLQAHQAAAPTGEQQQQQQGDAYDPLKIDLLNPFPDFGFHPELPAPSKDSKEYRDYLLSLPLEDRALLLALSECQAESGEVPQSVDGSSNPKGTLRPWASLNGRNLRVGEIILIIDADTVVPEDCFRDAAREMLGKGGRGDEEGGEGGDGGESVGIIQHESDVMQVAHHYFENGITHFTRRINKCISYGCANGEVAPFVGHNAFLRWRAVQDASFIEWDDVNQTPQLCWVGVPKNAPKVKGPWYKFGLSKAEPQILSHEESLVLSGSISATSTGLSSSDIRNLYTNLKQVHKKRGVRKIWSENNVSEDFDMALRLLLRGYNLRWATYSKGGFKEGVSLTIVDELARWQKYAYGCDEIIFNPIVKWWRKGPISEQLSGFMRSDAPVHYKIGMSSYMFSYYGIAAACIGSILNFLLLGLASEIDRFYLHSFEILLACVVVFPGIGNLGFTLLEYRLGHRSVGGSAVENLRWVPFFVFFFGGLSIHLSTAILAHLFSYDMTWGSTGKEVEKSTFWIEVPRIIKNFRLSFIICFSIIVMMILFTTNAVPVEWQIPGWQWALNIPLALVVGCHILFPIVLNPWLMKFSY